jgi:hypothetical protein
VQDRTDGQFLIINHHISEGVFLQLNLSMSFERLKKSMKIFSLDTKYGKGIQTTTSLIRSRFAKRCARQFDVAVSTARDEKWFDISWLACSNKMKCLRQRK